MSASRSPSTSPRRSIVSTAIGTIRETYSGTHERSSSTSAQVRNRGSRSSALAIRMRWTAGSITWPRSSASRRIRFRSERAISARRGARSAIVAIRSSTTGRRSRSTERSLSGRRALRQSSARRIDFGRGRTRPAAPMMYRSSHACAIAPKRSGGAW